MKKYNVSIVDRLLEIYVRCIGIRVDLARFGMPFSGVFYIMCFKMAVRTRGCPGVLLL